LAAPSPRAVLMVEDESVVARDIQETLSELGYQGVATAASAEEAMARARENRPGVALVDIRIKGRLDGIRTAELLQQGFGAAIVYLTAHGDDATIERAMLTHPSGFLLKPVKTAELKSALEIAFQRRAPEAPARETPVEKAGASRPPPAHRDVKPPGAGALRRQLDQIFASPDFDASRRSREFLRFVVEETLAGRGQDLTQVAIAVRVFGRKDDFDAVVDPIVRIQAGRLRRSLERYYLLDGRSDPVRIELPKGGYAPVFQVSEVSAPTRDQDTRPGERPGGWPSVLLNPFEVSGTGADVEGLAARVSEELALELGRYRTAQLFQPPESGSNPPYPARFALGGRIWREGEDVRITARLVDRQTGEQVWGDEYHTAAQAGRWSGTPEDVAHVIAGRVGAEEGVIVQHLAAERRKHRPAAPTAYDAMLRSYEFFLARDLESFVPTVEALRRTVETQPDCGPAWTRLARLYCANYAFELSGLETPIEESITCAQRGVRLDPASRSARCVLASALIVKGELGAARAELEQALRSSPGSLVYLEIIGWLLTMIGDWERGALLSRSARDRNPHCLPQGSFGLWADHLRRGETGLAYQTALEYRDPTFFWRSVMRASSLGLLGRTVEAKSEVADLLAARPDFPTRGRILLGHYLKLPELMDPVVKGLARAGLKIA
jgi:DNA-binding NarL/FixJ family response regulator/TolB-like protein